jgi:hypothetical protein
MGVIRGGVVDSLRDWVKRDSTWLSTLGMIVILEKLAKPGHLHQMNCGSCRSREKPI